MNNDDVTNSATRKISCLDCRNAGVELSEDELSEFSMHFYIRILDSMRNLNM